MAIPKNSIISRQDIETTGFTYYTTTYADVNIKEDIEKFAALGDEYFGFRPFILEWYITSGLIKIRMYEGQPNHTSQYFFIGSINTLSQLNSILLEIKLAPSKIKVLYNSGKR